jgi:hypothetical protein
MFQQKNVSSGGQCSWMHCLHEEFRTWVSDNMATYLARELRFNKSVYKEIFQILRDFDTVAAIIPEDEEKNMKYLIEGVHMITTDSGNADR